MTRSIALFFLILMVIFYREEHAQARALNKIDALDLRHASLCLRQLSNLEQQHQIPSQLLKAISMTESGLYHKASNQMIPWPWAVNVEGKAYYYPTKVEAVQAVRKHLKKGRTSIDVGCMQINLKYHPTAFSSLENAFDPKQNIAYAANFLKNNYARHSSWKKAIASYHSETASLGQPYAQKVLNTWKKERLLLASNTYPHHFSVSYPSHQLTMKNTSSKETRNYSYLSPQMAKRRTSNLLVRVKNTPASHTFHSNIMGRTQVVDKVAENTLRQLNKSAADTNTKITQAVVLD